ncbi:MAG TPA: FadR/GntR family transcriptional regulator [Solirubrobacteraceae bacterium]|nr:FadR/GntR family transcriptional regulator [Solirubrobacteraceae bacterium]
MSAKDHLRPVERKPLYEEISDRLREFIDVNELKPGDRLMTEREVGVQLGVSRHTVRQALTALRVTGLIEIRHGDGIYLLRSPHELVPSLALELLESQADYPYIWEVRQAIENQAARLAARRRTAADLRRMRDALHAMADAVDKGEDGVAGDRRFHDAVLAAAHNPVLSKVIEQLTEAFARTSMASLSQAGQPARSLADHRLILDAIQGGDEDAAMREMRGHLERTTNVAFVRDPD